MGRYHGVGLSHAACGFTRSRISGRGNPLRADDRERETVAGFRGAGRPRQPEVKQTKGADKQYALWRSAKWLELHPATAEPAEHRNPIKNLVACVRWHTCCLYNTNTHTHSHTHQSVTHSPAPKCTHPKKFNNFLFKLRKIHYDCVKRCTEKKQDSQNDSFHEERYAVSIKKP